MSVATVGRTISSGLVNVSLAGSSMAVTEAVTIKKLNKMKKLKQEYVCGDCGQDYKQWVGKCKSCGQQHSCYWGFNY